jgi:hypothetical protein
MFPVHSWFVHSIMGGMGSWYHDDTAASCQHSKFRWMHPIPFTPAGSSAHSTCHIHQCQWCAPLLSRQEIGELGMLAVLSASAVDNGESGTICVICCKPGIAHSGQYESYRAIYLSIYLSIPGRLLDIYYTTQ